MALNKEAKELVAQVTNNNTEKIALSEFNRVMKESKKLSKVDKKGYMKIANKSILKQRLVQLYCCGFYSINQIASILLVTPSTVKRLLKEPEINQMILSYQDEEKSVIDSRIKSLRLKATETISELMDSDDDSIRLQASRDILDRTGHKAKDERDININVSYEQQLEQLVEGVHFIDVESTCADEVKIIEEGAVNGD